MKLEFISNTGFYLEHRGTVIGNDLWLTQGAFEGSWFHFPPLRPTHRQVSDCRYIYISHIHPDHCDFNALRRARPDARFIVPDYFNRLIERKLRAFGFKDVVSLAPLSGATLEPGLKVRLYPQFVNNLFHSAAFGSLIDSALAIEWDGRTILNCNDNYLVEEWARRLKEQYPRLDLLLAPHSASGPYPASFRNLSEDQRLREAEGLQQRYVTHVADMVAIMAPRLAVPCAAEYVVVGELHRKNRYIGLADAGAAAREINARMARSGGATRAVRLDCGTTLDVDTGELGGLPVREPSMEDRLAYAESLAHVPFPHHWEDSFQDEDLDALFLKARERLWRHQQRLRFQRDYLVTLYSDESPAYAFNFASPEAVVLGGRPGPQAEPRLDCYLPRQLLYRALAHKAHWNNAEGGLLIDFYRKPDEYVPEVHTLMSFLHS